MTGIYHVLQDLSKFVNKYDGLGLSSNGAEMFPVEWKG